MLLAGAFVYINFISVYEIISSALYIFEASPHLSFPWMVIMKLQVSLAHFRLRCPSVVYVLLDYPVMDRQLLAMISSLRYFH